MFLAIEIVGMFVVMSYCVGSAVAILRDGLRQQVLHLEAPLAAESLVADPLDWYVRARLVPSKPIVLDPTDLPLTAGLLLILRGAIIVSSMLFVGLYSRWGLRFGVPPEIQNAMYAYFIIPVSSVPILRKFVRDVYENLLWPAYTITVLEMSVVVNMMAIAAYVIICLLPAEVYRTVPYATAHQTVLVMYICVKSTLVQVAIHAAQDVARGLYDEIRDANYLRGRRLVNHAA